jgi:hypothetical protein
MSESRRDTPRTLLVAGALLALLVADRTVQLVRQVQEKSNGHAEVRPKDAVEFWDLQKEIQRDVREGREENRRRFDALDTRMERAAK